MASLLYKYYHTGKDNSLDTSEVGATHAVVLKLLEGLEGRGHHVYTDNYYSSPDLFGDLQRLACGTVRKNRRGVPDEMKAKLKGEVVSKQLDSSMFILKWMDKREVMMLSTIHDDSFVTKKRRSRTAPDGQEGILKPLIVEEYKKNTRGVDTSDQLQSYYGFSHRTVKWWRWLFFHLIDLAIVNAYILYLMSPCSRKKLTHAQFRVELAKQLLMETAPSTEEELPVEHPPGTHTDPNPPSSRLTGRHFSGKLGVSAAGRQIQPDCCLQSEGERMKINNL